MKKLVLKLFLFLPIYVFGQSIEQITFFSKGLNQERSFLIYKPEEMLYSPEKRFEVIYVFDAQRREMFDFVHSSIKFIDHNLNFIIVGIQSPYFEIGDRTYGRNDDMLPKAIDDETKKSFFDENSNGNADSFKQHINDELFPLIENNYRTLPLRVAVGHSNSASFVSHCFLEDSEMFDVYFMQSPNFAYDREQFVNRFEKFDFDNIENNKFLFISNANESEKTGWNGWQEAREKIYKILQNQKNEKIHFKVNQYPDLKHWNSFIESFKDGIESFIDYQFRTGKNIISYYQSLDYNKLIDLNPEVVNNLAYQCFWNQKAEEALVVIEWAINMFPNDDNLYDNRGEFFESLEKYEKAKASYLMALNVLKQKKSTLDLVSFENKERLYRGNYNRVKEK